MPDSEYKQRKTPGVRITGLDAFPPFIIGFGRGFLPLSATRRRPRRAGNGSPASL